MTRDAHVIVRPQGTIRITGAALSGLVVAAAEQVPGARVRRPRRGLDIAVDAGRARVELELSARYGTVLPQLGRAVQEGVSRVLRDAAGLEVERVDVSVEELDA